MGNFWGKERERESCKVLVTRTSDLRSDDLVTATGSAGQGGIGVIVDLVWHGS